ncbi:DegT/DnrJ/EryC1/StrS aminotransferase family protein [Methanosarcina sp. KYL-1]|uniref:DegT/DnrJ/EryC1/StrS family aminotransferase n=1 Tax=Methanosarcina sp. KYL-1 TaxID=2602068 RepID=UPI0021012817|nr:DegT/DnrJ/EryC1/StrS aminotransferase family protein [Methanosarcina sp. KYL-1]
MNLNSEADITQLEELFCNSSIGFTNSGRTSLYVILKALQLPPNSKIGVPLYTCPSDFDAILHAGYKPHFLDIDPENYTLSPESLEERIEEVEAVIAVHTFGRVSDLDRILKITGERPLIEDCAHALLSKLHGELLGTKSTAGFFSFRSGKYLSAGEGGMITANDPDLALRIRNEIEKLPKLSIANEIKHTLTTYMRSTLYHRPWFGSFALPIGSLVEKKIDIMNKYSFPKTKIRNTDLHTITEKIQIFEENVEKQRENSIYLLKKLKDSGSQLKLPFEKPHTYCNCFLFPIQFKDESTRDKVSNSLRKKGVDTAKMFSNTPLIAKSLYGYKNNCPDTEKVSEKVLVVPNYYTLKKNELEMISEIVKACLH